MKFLIAPSLVLFATLLGKRFGNSFGGWLIAMPLISAPAAYVIASKFGFVFAYQVIAGMMFATISQIVFAFFYSQVSKKHSAVNSLFGGMAGFALSTFFLKSIHLGLIIEFTLVVFAVILGIKYFGKIRSTYIKDKSRSPFWDIPVRVATATLVVFAITEISPHIGANLAGLLSPFPVLAAVLAFFTHISDGALEARLVLKGLIMGLLTPAFFFFILGLTIKSQGNLAFLYALAVALVVQYLSGKRIAKQDSAE